MQTDKPTDKTASAQPENVSERIEAYYNSKCDCTPRFVNPNCELHGAHEYHGKPQGKATAAPEAQHSPLPWTRWTEQWLDDRGIDGEGQRKHLVMWHNYDIDQLLESRDKLLRLRERDAKLIVASVNHADKLAAALRVMVTANPMSPAYGTMQAKAALAAYEEAK